MNKLVFFSFVLSFGCTKIGGPCEFTQASGEIYCIDGENLAETDSDEFSYCPPEGIAHESTEDHSSERNSEEITCSSLGFTTDCGNNIYSSSEEACNNLDNG